MLQLVQDVLGSGSACSSLYFPSKLIRMGLSSLLPKCMKTSRSGRAGFIWSFKSASGPEGVLAKAKKGMGLTELDVASWI